MQESREPNGAPVETEPPGGRDAAAELTPRLFWPILLLMALVGLLLRLQVGRKTYISFDEWQHVFMAASARWKDLVFELRTNSHPALFFLLLRPIVRLGHVALYRSISIGAGTASIIMVGLIARRVFNSTIVQLVCAAAFALSADAISISVEIRSYQLTIFLTLSAFLCWLDMFRRSERIRVRPYIFFAVCASLAVFCHYSAIFFLGACLATPLLLTAMNPRLRQIPVWPAVAALALPFAVFGAEYWMHVRHQILQAYDPAFYGGGMPNETNVSFLIRNSQNFLNLFSPVEFRSTAASLSVIGLLLACAAWVFWKSSRGKPARTWLSAGPILFAIVMVLEIVVASLAGKYPFGGMMRHQYIAGPFLLIAVFALVDHLITSVGPMVRATAAALLMCGVIGNLIVQWPALIIYPGEVILKDEFQAWRSAFPDTHAVYLDHWAVIGYFIHTSDRPRHFVRRIPDASVIDQYHVPDKTSQGTEIFYDKTRDNLNLGDSSVYRSFAACLRSSGVRELGLFYYSAGDRPLPWSPEDLKKLITQKAAEQGLKTTRVIAGATTVYAAFTPGGATP